MKETPDQAQSSVQATDTPPVEAEVAHEVEASIELGEAEISDADTAHIELSKEDEQATQIGPKNLRETIYEKLIKPIINADSSPQSIALGAAIGMFIALTPTVGIQMPIAVFCGTMFNRFTRFQVNNLVAAAMCWVSNPLTFIPMYYGYLWLGWQIYGRDTSALMSLASWQQRLTAYIKTDSPTTWDYVQGFFLAGLGELAAPMWLGSLIIAVIITIPTYPVVLYIVKKYQARRKQVSA